MPRRFIPSFGLAALTLTACGGGGLSGTYTPVDPNPFIDKMEFQKGGTVVLTRWGQTKQGSFVAKGNQVTVSNSGTVVQFTIDAKGCLDAPMIGKLCKSGLGGTPAGSDGVGSGVALGLTGTWQANFAGNSITLEFRGDKVVHATMRENGVIGESEEGTYETTPIGYKVTMSNGPPLMLTRKGNQLEGAVEGLTITFNRR